MNKKTEKKPNPKIAQLYRHKETKKLFKIAPWYECIDPILDDKEIGKEFTEGRKFKIGSLVQVGWLICNEHDVYFGVHTDALEMFEKVDEKDVKKDIKEFVKQSEPGKLRQFKKNVLWEFKIAITGHGKNIKESLMDAAQKLDDQVQFNFQKSDFEAIEKYELVNINEKDIIE